MTAQEKKEQFKKNLDKFLLDNQVDTTLMLIRFKDQDDSISFVNGRGIDIINLVEGLMNEDEKTRELIKLAVVHWTIEDLSFKAAPKIHE